MKKDLSISDEDNKNYKYSHNQYKQNTLKENSLSYDIKSSDRDNQLEINFKKSFNNKSNINEVLEAETLTHENFEGRRTLITNSIPPKRLSDFFIYPLLGITCFISMNTFISCLDCFKHYQLNYYPGSYFNNIFFFANTIVQIVLSCVNINKSTWNLLKYSLLIPFFILILFPIFISFFNNIYNYIFCCFLILINGAFSGLYLYLMNGILPFIDFRNLVFVISGQAISSVLVSITKIFTFFVFDSYEQEVKVYYSLILTFSFSILIIFFTLILLYFLRNRDDFYSCFKKLDKKHKTGLFDSAVLIGETESEHSENFENIKKSQFELMKITINNNKLFFANVLFFGFITFLFHPVVFIQFKLFSKDVEDLSINLTIIFFNVFDSLGRLSTNLFFIKTKKKLFMLNYLRSYFIVIFTLIGIFKHKIIENFLTNNGFVYINIAIFAYTFGFINCNSFIILGGIKDQIIQFKSNMVTSICIGTGVFIGSFISNILSMILF